jgi:predicted  nucleic acid-binding Zn-ribbon protein
MTKFEPELEHEKFDELCALAAAGILAPTDLDLLALHLKTCVQCREAFAQYQDIATEGMHFLADHFVSRTGADEFEESAALTRLMQAAEAVEQQPSRPFVATGQQGAGIKYWLLGSVAASLVVAIGVGAYWTGVHSVNARLQVVSTASQSALGRVQDEKQSLERTIQEDNRKIVALEQQSTLDEANILTTQGAATASAEHIAQLTRELSAAKRAADVQLATLTQERDANANKLLDAEQMYRTVQEELNTLRNQHEQDLVHLASLKASVDGLTSDLDEQSKRAMTDEQYLSSDKDIRDLIGARNLYIADIMDVNGSGQSRKPFGRVFYTKTKSLIFYAYDLDRQPGVRQTSTFQVWGRTGVDDRKPINLGILYMDSATNRRWTLRVDNPAQLARLDSVFVTIEPREQTDRPTGKPFLYASLRREPNHP